MKPARSGGRHAHIFVCTNRRPATDPLGPGCGDRGQAVYDAATRAVLREGLVSRVWTTRTFCMGICPREGTTVAMADELFTEVRLDDVPSLIALAKEKTR